MLERRHEIPRVGGSQRQAVCRVLPFEVQLKIIVWVECFVTMDKRKKLLGKFKGLPNATLQASHNTSDRMSGGTKWWCVFLLPRHLTVTTATTATDYMTTGYR